MGAWVAISIGNGTEVAIVKVGLATGIGCKLGIGNVTVTCAGVTVIDEAKKDENQLRQSQNIAKIKHASGIRILNMLIHKARLDLG
jgi:hypothetical protein